MRAMRTKLFIAAGALLAVILGVIVAAPMLLKGPVRTAILGAAQDQLTADLVVGDVSLSLLRSFPSASVRLQGVTITGRDQHAGRKLLELERLDLTVNLASLLGGPMQIESIELVRPVVTLVRGEDGTPNWQITRPSEPSEPSAEPGAVPELALDAVSIDGGALLFEDAGLLVEVADLSFDGTADLSGTLSQASARLSVGALTVASGGQTWLEDSRVAVGLKAEIDQGKGLLTVKENTIELDQLAMAASGTVTLPDSGPNVLDLTLAATAPSIAALISLVPGLADGALDGMTTDGTLSLTGYARGPVGDALPAFGGDLTIVNGSYSHSAVPEPVTDIQVAVHMETPGPTLDSMVVNVERFDCKLAGNPLHLQATVRKPMSSLDVDLDAKGDVDLGQLGALIPRKEAGSLSGRLALDVAYAGSVTRLAEEDYTAAKARGSVDLTDVSYTPDGAKLAIQVPAMAMKVTPAHVSVDRLEVIAGRTDLSATGRIDNALAYLLKGENLTGTLTTRSKVVDVDELMLAFAGGPDGDVTPTPGEGSPKQALRLPEGIDLSLTSAVERLTVSGIPMDDAQVRVQVVDRVLKVEEASVSMMDGRVSLAGTYDSNPLQPLVDMGLDLKKVDIGSLVKQFPVVSKLAPIAANAIGAISTDLRLLGSLDDGMGLVLDSLSGTGDFIAHQLSIRGSQALETIGNALKSSRFSNASLDGVAAHFQVENGTVDVRPFKLMLGPIQGTFGGSHQFDQDIAYDLDLLLPAKEFTGQAQSALAGLSKGTPFAGKVPSLGDTVQVGVDITGTVFKPIIKLDLKNLAASAQDVLKQVVETAVEEVVKVADKGIDAGKAAADAALAKAQTAANAARKQAYAAAERGKTEGYRAADRLVSEAKNPIAKLAAQAAMTEAKRQADRGLADAKKKADDTYAASIKKANAEYEAGVATARKGVQDAPTAVRKTKTKRKTK